MNNFEVADLLLVLEAACARFRELVFCKDNRDLASVLFDCDLMGKNLCEMLSRAVAHLDREKSVGRFGDFEEACALGFVIFEAWMFLEKYDTGMRHHEDSPSLLVADDHIRYSDDDVQYATITRPSTGQMAMIIVADFIRNVCIHQWNPKEEALGMLAEMPPGLDMFHRDMAKYMIFNGVNEFDASRASAIRIAQTESFIRELTIDDMVLAVCRPMRFHLQPLRVLVRFSMCPPRDAPIMNNSPLLGAIRAGTCPTEVLPQYHFSANQLTQTELDSALSVIPPADEVEQTVRWIAKIAEAGQPGLKDHAQFILRQISRIAWSGFSMSNGF